MQTFFNLQVTSCTPPPPPAFSAPHTGGRMRLAAAAGVLALLVTACLNPLSGFSPESAAPVHTASPAAAGTPSGIRDTEPFTVGVYVGQPDDAARSNGSLTGDRIKENSTPENNWTGVRNFVQLVVVDAEGNLSVLEEKRKSNDAELNANFTVRGLSYGNTYKFLMLMGHWERDYEAETGGNYEYLEENPPTLLAAGYVEEQTVSRGQTIHITLYPLVVDTEFTGGPSPEPEVAVTDWLWTSLLTGSWNITWTITPDALSQLSAADLDGGGIFTDSQAVIRGQGVNDDADRVLSVNSTGNYQYTLSVPGDYTVAYERRGKYNSANLQLKYRPFGKVFPDWQGIAGETYFTAYPEWIIRNGVNDRAQDADTTFESDQKWDGTQNGNGAVVFVTGYEWPAADPADADDLNDTDVEELDLRVVLRQPDVPAAMEELHRRIQNKQRGGLKLGMYLDLPSLKPTGEEPIMFDSSTRRTELASLSPWALPPEEESATLVDVTRENLRILIASFDQYKDAENGAGTKPNTQDHIKLTFKHIPVLKKMRSVDTSEGGYPGGGDTAVARPYLEGPFYEGLKAALGINENVFYPVTRGLAGGTFEDNYNVKEDYTAAVFIDTEYEVRGRTSYVIEEVLKQTALYKKEPEYKRKFSYDVIIGGGWGFESTYWLASPYPRWFKPDVGLLEEQQSGENNKFLIISEDAQTRALQEGATGAFGTVNVPTPDPNCSYGMGVDYIQNRRVPTDQRAVDYFTPSRPTAGVSPSFCIR